MAGDKNAEKQVSISSSTKIKVKNISKAKLMLASGTLDPDKTGESTMGEYRCYVKFLELK